MFPTEARGVDLDEAAEIPETATVATV